MVEAAAPQRRPLARFTPWVNRLEMPDNELPKVPDVRKTVKKVEFRDAGPIVKHFDCRILTSKHPVTKGYAERKKRDPIFDAFGIGGGDEAIRGNAHITMLHRDNVWHPYFEIQTEEEDLGTKIRNRQAQKRGDNVEGDEIKDLESQVANLQKAQNDDATNAIQGPKKRTFDAKALQAKKATMEQEEEKKIPDPKGIRLTEIPNSVNEQMLCEAIVEKFGPIERCFMPMEQMRNTMRNRGFAIINFKNASSAQRAIQEAEISIEFAAVAITQSYQQQRRDGGRDGNRRDFDILKRGPR